MEIKVHSIHFDADHKLINFIQEKMSKIEQYYDNILGGEVYLRIDKSDNAKNKVAEIREDFIKFPRGIIGLLKTNATL